MRQLVVVIAAIIALGRLAGTAQDATPDALAQETRGAIERTDLHYVVPFTAEGLNQALTVTAVSDGACDIDSSMATSRPDAWSCTTEGSVLDPCFEPGFLPSEAAQEVACLSTPWSTEVVMLTLTSPLEREKELVPAASGPGATADEAIQPWDLPWAVDLANGDRCSLMHGTLTVAAGQTVYYGCEQQGTILGEIDHSQPVWTVTYVADGAIASDLVAVVSAWT